jgi:hypothetical protein
MKSVVALEPSPYQTRSLILWEQAPDVKTIIFTKTRLLFHYMEPITSEITNGPLKYALPKIFYSVAP